ncbi:MAG TPA: hypothetical protein VGO67_01560 [Verrucomicrobiae bacterium]
MSSQSHVFPAEFAEATQSPSLTSTSLPWYCYAVAFGVACMPVGVLWDISWHLSIGRDSFWNPAHVMMYMGGSIPGMVCGWLVIKNTFWPDPGGTSATVGVWGFRGPLGAWFVIWGAFMMILSAPFDNWWHNAYGLDVQIISPPHTVLALGTYAIAIGSLLLVVSWLNRAPVGNLLAANLLVLFACGVLLLQLTVFLTEYSYPNSQHNTEFYAAICRALPVYLIIAARVSKIKWSATLVSAMYMIIKMAMIWILPHFPAHPKLAPIYNPLTHMAPPPFPMLLIVPAFGIDLIMQTLGRKRGFWHDTGLAVLLTATFFLLLLAVEWPFSEFLLSPGARNPFFGGNMMWGYPDRLGAWCTQFWSEENRLTVKSSLLVLLTGSITARIALLFGNWLSEVKR